jgi:phosphoglycerate dehydrogenase-like enzyme
VLVIGAGSIGTSFARLVKAMEARTIGVRRAPGNGDPAFDELHTLSELDMLLPQADVVALALPETPETIGLMDERRFGLMKEGSYLLNVDRGSVLDQKALLSALRSGRLAGAGVDVTSPEPLPPEHPLWKEKNMLITPHISGFYNLRETHDQGVEIACNNLRAFPEGPYTSRIDFNLGYRTRET